MSEREYTVSGFMMPDDPGINVLRHQPAMPFMLSTQNPDQRWRSARWWLTRWWPKRLRVWLCYWYGHPPRCMERYSTTEVVAVDDTMVNGEPSWTFEATGTYCRVDECCHLCGWEHHVQF